MSSPDFRFTAIQTMPVLTGDVHDLSPVELADFVRVDPGAMSRDITGFVAGIDGRVIVIHNVGALHSITLKNESALSIAANRMRLPGGIQLIVRSQASAYMVYDGIDQRWKVLASS